MTIPPSRCGFELTQKIFTQRGVSDEARRQEILKLDVEDWHRKYNVSSCWRPIRKDSDQCIWHANLEPKSNEDLVSAYSSEEITIDSNFHWRPGDPKPFYSPVIDGTNISGVDLIFITGQYEYKARFSEQ